MHSHKQRAEGVCAAKIVDAKEAGAAGVLGTVAQISMRGAPVMSSFAAAVGLDAPVEVWPSCAHIDSEYRLTLCAKPTVQAEPIQGVLCNFDRECST